MKRANLKTIIANIHADESGATATEYIILLVCVACFVIAAVKLFGSTVSSKFGKAQETLARDVSL